MQSHNKKGKKKKLLERMHPVQMALLMLKDMEIKQIIFWLLKALLGIYSMLINATNNNDFELSIILSILLI